MAGLFLPIAEIIGLIIYHQINCKNDHDKSMYN